MGSLATEFRNAYFDGSGDKLAVVFMPIATRQDPDRLRSFYEFTNPTYLTKDLHYSLFHGRHMKLPKSEQNLWVEIFAAYWEGVGELLKWEDRYPGASAVTIYNAWKKMCNALIRAYTASSGLDAWTLPCLYTAGKYLRVFAIKADDEVVAQGSMGFGLQDEINADSNANLSDAALVMNRMFTLCLSDR